MNKIKKLIFLTSNVKVWLALFGVGLIIVFFSLFIGFLNYFNRISNFLLRKFFAIINLSVSARAILAFILFLFGVLALIYSAYKIYKFFSEYNEDLFENTYREAKLAKGKKIVTIGGGTGQYTLLNGLKEFTSNITAVVTTMDSGGSSQLLKTEFGVLPPGDLRNCIIALSPLEDELRMVFNKRFKKNSSLKGHTLGNLFITRVAQDYGYDKALEVMETLLRTRGKVLPVTKDKVELIAITEKGDKLYGEAEIGRKGLNIKEIFLNQEAKANPEVLEAIYEADIIVLGPGSLFTSVLPNLLVKGIPEAIKNSKAKKVYVQNVMSQYPETHGLTAEHYLSWIEKFVNIDYVLLNSKKPSKEILDKYVKEKKYYVEPVLSKTKNRKIILKDLVNDKNPARHDSIKLAKAIVEL